MKKDMRKWGRRLRLMGVIISKHKYTVESHALLMLLYVN